MLYLGLTGSNFWHQEQHTSVKAKERQGGTKGIEREGSNQPNAARQFQQ